MGDKAKVRDEETWARGSYQWEKDGRPISRDDVTRIVEAAHGNISRAAIMVGIADADVMHRMVKRFGLLKAVQKARAAARPNARQLRTAMDADGWHHGKTAAALEISRPTLRVLLAQYGMSEEARERSRGTVVHDTEPDIDASAAEIARATGRSRQAVHRLKGSGWTYRQILSTPKGCRRERTH